MNYAVKWQGNWADEMSLYAIFIMDDEEKQQFDDCVAAFKELDKLDPKFESDYGIGTNEFMSIMGWTEWVEGYTFYEIDEELYSTLSEILKGLYGHKDPYNAFWDYGIVEIIEERFPEIYQKYFPT